MENAILAGQSWCIDIKYYSTSVNNPSMPRTNRSNTNSAEDCGKIHIPTSILLTSPVISTINYFSQYIWKVPVIEGYTVLIGFQDSVTETGGTDDGSICHMLVYTGGNWTLQHELCAHNWTISAEICFEQPEGMALFIISCVDYNLRAFLSSKSHNTL